MAWTIAAGGSEVSLLAVAGLGCTVGMVAGMFGVGGGFLLVPLLHVFVGVPLPLAVGAGLCQTVATALGSLLRYRTMGHAETRFDVLLLGGSLLGVDAGTRLLHALTGLGTVDILGKPLPILRVVITACYVVLFLVMAGILWLKSTPEADAVGEPGPLARLRLPPLVGLPVAGISGVSAPLVAYIGFGNGVLAGMLGIGGGIVLIPIMLYGFGFNIRKTAGTGIVVVLAVAIIGTIQHGRLGNVHLGLAATLMIGSALAAQVGANLTRSLPASLLRRGLAAVLVLANVALVFKLLR